MSHVLTQIRCRLGLPLDRLFKREHDVKAKLRAQLSGPCWGDNEATRKANLVWNETQPLTPPTAPAREALL